MKAAFLKGAVVGALISCITLASSAALAGTGIGAVFDIGATNTTNASTVLQGSTNGPQLRVVNNAASGAGAAGVGIHTATNKPPLAVNSRTKVTNLNADLLDGQDSTAFVGGGGRIVSARLESAISSVSSNVLTVPGFGTMQSTCALTGFGLVWHNGTNPSSALDEWFVTNGQTRFINQANNTVSTPVAIDVKGDQTFSAEMGRPGHTATWTVSAHWTPTGCIFHGQTVVQ